MLEPLGQSQVLAYLGRLAADFAITLLSFEKKNDLHDGSNVDELRSRLEALSITWVPLVYHKWPPVLSTVWDVARARMAVRRIARAGSIRIIHARSYVPALIALAVVKTTRAKFLFDMRGFWVDEKVEAGRWRRGGLLYRLGKRWERRFLEGADAIVSLTHEGVRCLPQLGFQPTRGIPVEVIPTCVDLECFMPGPKDARRLAALGLGEGPIVGSVGTISNRYFRKETLRYLAYLTESIPYLQVLLVTRDDHAELRQDAERVGLRADRLVLTSVDFSEMPALIRLIDVGVFFMKPVFAQKGSAATKMAEFLACGIPVIVNDGVADSSAIVRSDRVGVVLPDVTGSSFRASLGPIRALFGDSEISRRCRDTAVRRFDIGAGVDRYRELYCQIVPDA